MLVIVSLQASMYQSKRNINYNLGNIYFLGNDLHCTLLCCRESEAASSSVLGHRNTSAVAYTSTVPRTLTSS